MAKVTGPLLSLDASGSVAKTMTFSRWKGINYVRQRVIPTYTNTALQIAVRLFFKQASQAWKTGASDGTTTLNSGYKTAMETAAAGTGMSGFNLFMQVAALKNDVAGGYTAPLVHPVSYQDITP